MQCTCAALGVTCPTGNHVHIFQQNLWTVLISRIGRLLIWQMYSPFTGISHGAWSHDNIDGILF